MATSGVGAMWPAEWRKYRDPVSDVEITQLTGYKGHTNHLYFTNPGWYDSYHKMLLVSDRQDATNLFSIDLRDGAITQLTDLDESQGTLSSICVSPAKDRACFYQGPRLMALDLGTLELRHIYTRPDGYTAGSLNMTADGKHVCTAHGQDLSDRIRMDLGHGYIGFREYWEAHPHCMIVKVALDGSGSQVAYEEDYWLGHINTSPKLPNILTFCHEGPWNLVENRIWGLDMDSGASWMIRPNAPDEAIGHEYWMADGEHIGYHGRTPGGPVYGAIRYDNTDQVEAPFTYSSMHFHSRALDYIIGDGGRNDPYVLIWRFRDGAFEGPRVLANHRCSFHTQRQHVHPCVRADGRQVVYTADPQGYAQVYAVDMPDFDALPDRDSLK